MDTNILSDESILFQYKEQSHVEAGFKFIKNDTFQVDEMFLKSPRRIGALMMIMTLCLMVYNFAQYTLRNFLKKNNDVLPNQKGKPVQNPTTQWVFTLMSAISIVEIKKNNLLKTIVANVHPLHKKIIAYFGFLAKGIYDVPIDLEPNQIDLNEKNWLAWCGM